MCKAARKPKIARKRRSCIRVSAWSAAVSVFLPCVMSTWTDICLDDHSLISVQRPYSTCLSWSCMATNVQSRIEWTLKPQAVQDSYCFRRLRRAEPKPLANCLCTSCLSKRCDECWPHALCTCSIIGGLCIQQNRNLFIVVTLYPHQYARMPM